MKAKNWACEKPENHIKTRCHNFLETSKKFLECSKNFLENSNDLLEMSKNVLEMSKTFLNCLIIA